MRRHVLAIAGLVILTASLATQAQKVSRPLTEEGLRTAQTPRRYEPPPPTASAKDLQERGDDFRLDKAYADAVDYYRAGLARTHDKTLKGELYNRIGIAELQLQHIHEAQKNFEKAIKSKANYAEAYNNLGASLYLQKKYGKAIDKYKEALKLNEADASFHSNLGTAYFDAKQLPHAVAEYSRAMQLDPNIFERSSASGISAKLSSPESRAQFNYILARMYARAGNFDRSIQCLRRAMEDGYKGIQNVYKDQEFTSLRRDPRFTELMAEKPTSIPE